MTVLTGQSPYSWSLEFWAEGFHQAYQIHDDAKDYSSLWLPVTSHASTVAEAVRLNNYDEIVYTLGNVFAWILSFVERFRLDLNESEAGKELLKQHGENWTQWILHKYPRVCHTCGDKPCICASRRDIMELRRGEKKTEYDLFMKRRETPITAAFHKLLDEEKAHEAITMPQLIEMFSTIYGGTLWGVTLSDVSFHFLEEIGEVSKEITYLGRVSRYSRKDWQECVKKGGFKDWDEYSIVCTEVTRELADVFSWTAGLCFKVAQLLKPTWKPSDALIKLYLGEIYPSAEKKRQAVCGTGKYAHIVCRYCGVSPCKEDCPTTQLQARLQKGKEESEGGFSYELTSGAGTRLQPS